MYCIRLFIFTHSKSIYKHHSKVDDLQTAEWFNKDCLWASALFLIGRTPCHKARALSRDNTTGFSSRSRPSGSTVRCDTWSTQPAKVLTHTQQRMLLPGQLVFLRRAEIRYRSKNAVLLALRSRSSRLIPWYNYPTKVVLLRSRHGINRIQKLHDCVWSLLSPPHQPSRSKSAHAVSLFTAASAQLWQFPKLSMHSIPQPPTEESSVYFILLRDKSCGLANFKILYLHWI